MIIILFFAGCCGTDACEKRTRGIGEGEGKVKEGKGREGKGSDLGG